MKQDTATGINRGDNYCYYYLHENGDLIHKTRHADTLDFEESPFVKKWWILDLENRMDAYNMLIAAVIFGANPERIKELASKWKITNEDAVNYLQRVGLNHDVDGSCFFVKPPDFIDMMQSIYGVGDSLFEAICDFYTKAINHETKDSKNPAV